MKTIKENSSATIKIQRSEFIAHLYPIDEVNQVKEIFSLHSEKYKDATHNCYAYVIGKKQEIQYYSDQGEPSGTAGKPILNSLLKYKLTNTLAIVTRYYGGIKLGIRGLIDAYSEVMELAISQSKIIDYMVYVTKKIECDYSVSESLKHLLKQYKVKVIPLEYSVLVKAEISFPEEYSSKVNKILDDFIQRGQISFLRD